MSARTRATRLAGALAMATALLTGAAGADAGTGARADGATGTQVVVCFSSYLLPQNAGARATDCSSPEGGMPQAGPVGTAGDWVLVEALGGRPFGAVPTIARAARGGRFGYWLRLYDLGGPRPTLVTAIYRRGRVSDTAEAIPLSVITDTGDSGSYKIPPGRYRVSFWPLSDTATSAATFTMR